MVLPFAKIFDIILKALTVFIISLGFLKVYVSYATIQTGYRIGSLKQKEMDMLDQRSILSIKLEKLTTKEHLGIMTVSNIEKKDSFSTSEVAQK